MTLQIEADDITYTVTRRYVISGIDPVYRWGNGDDVAIRGALLTPCQVTVTWTWEVTDPEQPQPWVQVWGHRIRANEIRADLPVLEIEAPGWRGDDVTNRPEWLARLAMDRPAVVATYGA